MKKPCFFYFLFSSLSCLFGAVFTHPQLTFEYDEKNWDVVELHKSDPSAPKVGESVDSQMAGKTIVSLQRKNADERYRSRFSIVVDSTKQAPTKMGEPAYAAYTRYSQKFLKSQRFSVLDTKDTKIGPQQVAASETSLFQRDFGLKFRQWILVSDAGAGQAYLLTFTSRTKPFDTYVTEIERLLTFLRFTDLHDSTHKL